MREDNLAPVRLEVVEDKGVQRDAEGWEHRAYVVRLTRGDESMLSPWRQGLGIAESPSAESVLESLISDAQGFWHAGRASLTPEAFEDWANEYGYDTDSRKAYATYREVGRLTDSLHDLIGDEDFTSAMDADAEEAARSLTDEGEQVA